ncbi:conserved hypothetical protein [Ricinus communis]|uniref:Uncharacterized protein n=1 Tax=Ricinus communis TaxID=3988 RepID=B9SWE3_RICCO|nr:conserved hypothetical protein [Ricinus communis]
MSNFFVRVASALSKVVKQSRGRGPLDATKRGVEVPTSRTGAARQEDDAICEAQASSEVTGHGATMSRGRGRDIGKSYTSTHTSSSRSRQARKA